MIGRLPAYVTADAVVLSYPADLSGWGRLQLDERSLRSYLRRSHERAARGDVWEVFLDVGCCGNTYDVPLRVERVEGGSEIGPETSIRYEERAACGLDSGWAVQSRAGPTGGSER